MSTVPTSEELSRVLHQTQQELEQARTLGAALQQDRHVLEQRLAALELRQQTATIPDDTAVVATRESSVLNKPPRL